MTFQIDSTARMPGRLLLVSLSLAAGAAQAGVLAEDSYSLDALATYLEPSEVRAAEADGPGVQLLLGAGLNGLPGWRLELSMAWNELQHRDGPGSDQIYQLGLDILRPFDTALPWQPYLAAGLAASYEEVRGDTSTRPTLGLGGGLFWQLPPPALRLRLDARALAQENDFESGGTADSGRSLLVDGRFGLGLQWRFLADAAPAPADADGDGVADAHDLCPGSLPDARVDATGCESVELADADGDGVPDGQDACPGTPQAQSVDARGCGEEAEVQLRGVNFEFDSDRLTAEARRILRPIAKLLQGGLSGIRIEIAGHTDAIGSADYNQALSARRAWAVKNFLAEQGVSPERMIATGYGASRPVADNASAAGRAQNRRVVFRVVE